MKKDNHFRVRDLIKELQKLDQNSIISKTTDNFEMGHCIVEARGVSEFKGRLEKEGFTDAFDGGSYSTEVIKHDDKGNLTFVRIS